MYIYQVTLVGDVQKAPLLVDMESTQNPSSAPIDLVQL